MFKRKIKAKILLLVSFAALMIDVYSAIYDDNSVYLKIWLVLLPLFYCIIYLRALLIEP